MSGSETHSLLNPAGCQNAPDDLITWLVMGTLFIALSVIWLDALVWGLNEPKRRVLPTVSQHVGEGRISLLS
ncbi:hypothetical protein [Xenorhabdus indica]|uniref:hypothetical protein n=1 Tax=Xenorhabdus indica TaxID=333964 RepID=UPI0016570C32|nr:hypothetical protein [Xenorhabdus indica]